MIDILLFVIKNGRFVDIVKELIYILPIKMFY